MKREIIEKYIPGKFKIRKEGNVAAYNVPVDEIPEIANQLYFAHTLQLKTITATDERSEGGGFKIYYVFGVPRRICFSPPT